MLIWVSMLYLVGILIVLLQKHFILPPFLSGLFKHFWRGQNLEFCPTVLVESCRPVARIFYGGVRSEKSGPQGVRWVRPGPHFLTKKWTSLTKKWTSAVCGGVRAHPSHPPWLRAWVDRWFLMQNSRFNKMKEGVLLHISHHVLVVHWSWLMGFLQATLAGKSGKKFISFQAFTVFVVRLLLNE